MDVAQNGDTVYVFNGSYWHEVLYINKSINLIGENRDTTLLARDDDRPLSINANYVNISGFSIYVARGGITSGAKLDISADYCTVSNIRFITPFMALCRGILYLHEANYTIIKNNILNDEGHGYATPRIGPAIRMYHSGNNIFENNSIPLFLSGIVLDENSDGNLFIHNFILSRFFIGGSSDITITGNNLFIITIQGSSRVNITDNNFQKYTFKTWKEAGPQVNFTNSDIFLDHNYWGRSRLLPKIFFGTKDVNGKIRYVLLIDWHPAKEPYVISSQ